MRALLNDLPLACREDLIELLEKETPVGTWDWNIAENTFLWSPRQFAHFGMQPPMAGSITYETWLEAIHPDDRATVQAALTATIASGNDLDLTFRVLWRDDDASPSVDVHWLHSRGRVVRGSDGAPLRMVGTSRDVTGVEQDLALTRARQDARLADLFGGPSRFDIYFQSARDCLVQFKVHENGSFTYQMINPAGLRMINLTMAAAHGLTPIDVLGPANGEQVMVALRSVVETGLPVRFEPTLDYGSQAVSYDATYIPVRDERGVTRAILCRARDVTEERRLAAALRQAQKMEALGELAAGVAHDFNNVLTSLRGCFSRLSRISHAVEVEHVIDLGSSALRQGEALTRRLLTFARKQEMFVEVVSLSACVENALGVLRSSVPEATICTNLAKSGCEVLADQGLIEACLLNLCINARDAQPNHCTIIIETKMIEPNTSPHVDLPIGCYASLSIHDNGPGMTEEVLARALEPFFTTKSSEKGNGLGLSMVYGNIKTLNGAVEIDSVVGLGTSIELFLPRHITAPTV